MKGELGYELYIPTEQAMHVYEEIVRTNEENNFGMVHTGLRALGSLRMEKMYRDYGHDLDNTDNILEAGLGFTCDFEKEGGFIGKDAVLLEKKNPLSARRRLVQVLVKDPLPLLYHGEVLWRNGEIMGNIRSSSYGFCLGGSVGIAMVDAGDQLVKKSFLESGTWEIEIGAQKYPCIVSLRTLFDPSNNKIKN